jgi:hypothetical protein
LLSLIKNKMFNLHNFKRPWNKIWALRMYSFFLFLQKIRIIINENLLKYIATLILKYFNVLETHWIYSNNPKARSNLYNDFFVGVKAMLMKWFRIFLCQWNVLAHSNSFQKKKLLHKNLCVIEKLAIYWNTTKKHLLWLICT